MNKKSIYIFLILAIVFIQSKAQSALQDVVYVKGGSIFRGVIQSENETSIHLLTIGSNVVKIDKASIDSMKNENVPAGYYMPSYLKTRGYFNLTDMGVLVGQSSNGAMFETVNGYRFNHWLAAGLGLNFHLTDVMLFPVYASLRTDILKKKTTPTLFADAGYNFIGARRNVYYYDFAPYGNEKLSGGFYCSAGFGVKFMMRSEAALTVSAAYVQNRWQREYSYTTEKTIYNYTYQRMCLKFGVEF